MHRYANPNRFLKIAKAVQPWSTAIAVLTLGAGLWFALRARRGQA